MRESGLSQKDKPQTMGNRHVTAANGEAKASATCATIPATLDDVPSEAVTVTAAVAVATELPSPHPPGVGMLVAIVMMLVMRVARARKLVLLI
jgi:hypothetical protein